jgi:uncharacterized protein (TIGR02246 family)
MFKTMRVLVVVFVLGFAAACQTQEAEQTGATEEATVAVDTEAIRAGIDIANEKWSQAAEAADATALASLYMEDAILAPPNAPRTVGRAAIEAAFVEMFTQVKFGDTDLTIDHLGIPESGELAYVVGSYSGPMIAADGTTFEDAGKYVAVFKNVNGEWLLAVGVDRPTRSRSRLRGPRWHQRGPLSLGEPSFEPPPHNRHETCINW